MGRVYLRGTTWYVSTTVNGKRIRRAVSKSRERAKTVLAILEDKSDAQRAQKFLENWLKNDCNGAFEGV